MHTATHMASAMTDVATILDSLAIPIWGLRYEQVTSERGGVIVHVRGGGALIDQLATVLDLGEPTLHPGASIYRRVGHLGDTAVDLFCGVTLATSRPVPCRCGYCTPHAA